MDLSPTTEGAARARLAQTRVLAIGGVSALIGLGLAWELWLAPTGRGTLAIKVLPLLLPLPGLLRDRLYTYRWLSLLVWLYVTEGVVRATSDRGLGATLGAIETVLCLAVFVAVATHVRAQLALDKRRLCGPTTGLSKATEPAP